MLHDLSGWRTTAVFFFSRLSASCEQQSVWLSPAHLRLQSRHSRRKQRELSCAQAHAYRANGRELPVYIYMGYGCFAMSSKSPASSRRTHSFQTGSRPSLAETSLFSRVRPSSIHTHLLPVHPSVPCTPTHVWRSGLASNISERDTASLCLPPIRLHPGWDGVKGADTGLVFFFALPRMHGGVYFRRMVKKR